MKLTRSLNTQQLFKLFTGPQAQIWSSAVASMREIQNALISNLTIGDNLVGQFSTVTVTTSANYTGGTFNPIVVPWNYADRKAPQSVLIAQIVNPSNQYPLLSAQSVMWTYDAAKEVINVSYISGLNNSNKYTVVFEIK